MSENCNLEDVEHIKKFVTIPVVSAGRMDPAVGAEAVKEGKIDGVGIARQFLADGEWVTKLINDKEEEIRPCICCHNGCFNMCHYKGVANDQELSDTSGMARCAVNAETMQTKKHFIERTKHPKKVAIIGGGVGGMEAARVLKLRGHDPVIYEKSNHLGGTFVAAGKASFKGKLRDLEKWYELQMKELGIEIHLNEEIHDIRKIPVDEYVIATGSKAHKLRIPGIENSVEAIEFLNGAPVGKKVVVVGGGLTGCEIAYELYLNNKEPTIVEMKDDLIAQKGICLANSSYLREYFALHKVPVYLETTVKEIQKNKVIVKKKDGSLVEIPTDSTIMSTGYISMPLASPSKHVHLVGDCLGVGTLKTVIWRAYEVAMKI